MIMLTDGLHQRVPRAEYDQSTRVNFSTAKEIENSPAHYQHILVSPRKDTDALKLGRATHHAVFEPERFRAEYVVWDMGDRRGKDWTAFKERNKGMEILKESEHEHALALSRAVRNSGLALPFISKGQSEFTLCWTHTAAPIGALPGYSIQMKARPDFVNGLGLADLKSCRLGSREGFGRAAAEYFMYAQAALYSDGYFAVTGTRLPSRLIAVEKKAPHVVSVYEVTEEQLAFGRTKYCGWLDRIAMCRRENHWPGYHEEVVPLELPHWVMPRDDEDASGMDLDFTKDEDGEGATL